MNFKEYQEQSKSTAIYPTCTVKTKFMEEYQEEGEFNTAIYKHVEVPFIYPMLGLMGECGEVSEKLKKVIRDHQGHISEELKENLAKELGDILWYISALSTELGFDLNEIAEKNIEKLLDRKCRNVIHGNGDNR